MKHKYCLSPHQDIRSRFEHDLPHIVALASSSRDETEFKQRLNKLLLSGNFHPDGVRNIARLIAYDGKTIFELSTESEIKLKTLSLLGLALFFKILCPYACHIHQTYIFF